MFRNLNAPLVSRTTVEVNEVKPLPVFGGCIDNSSVSMRKSEVSPSNKVRKRDEEELKQGTEFDLGY